jgi:hypothetical protein
MGRTYSKYRDDALGDLLGEVLSFKVLVFFHFVFFFLF